jgi:TRAP-type mannitol/chloroaromatic compound transport system substrate-binding protein
MRRKGMLRAGVGLLALAAAAGAASGAAAETWRVQTAIPAAHPVHQATERWARDVARMTGGRLVIEVLPGGAVVAPTELIDAVSQGILDGMATSSVYFTGRDRAFAILGDLIGGYQDWATALAFCEYGGGKELYRELYAGYGAFTIGCANSGVESLVASKPIQAVDDFKGVKIRAPEGMAASLFRKMGASPVALPPTEVFTAIDKKVVDGADYSSYAMNHSLGFHKIAKNPILHFHSLPIYEVTVNKAKWDKQPDDIKAILEMSVRDLAVRINLEDMIAERAALAADRAAGIEAIVWSAAELAKMRKLAAEVWAEYAQGSPMAQKAFAAHKAFLEKLGLLQ